GGASWRWDGHSSERVRGRLPAHARPRPRPPPVPRRLDPARLPRRRRQAVRRRPRRRAHLRGVGRGGRGARGTTAADGAVNGRETTTGPGRRRPGDSRVRAGNRVTPMNARGRAAAVLEVFGVYLAGQLVVGLLVRVLDLQPVNPLPGLTADVTDAELIAATGQLTVLLLLQYAGWFLLAVPINWWHRRPRPAAYGLTRAGRPWSALLLAGLATTALAAWPVLGVQLIDATYGLGETVPWRQALADTSWRRWQFWLFLGVLSFGLVAVA